jgi:hypothetical protein
MAAPTELSSAGALEIVVEEVSGVDLLPVKTREPA